MVMAAILMAACGRESTAPATAVREQTAAVRKIGLVSETPTPTVWAQGTDVGQLKSNNACTTLGYDFGAKIDLEYTSGTFPVAYNGVQYGTITLTSSEDSMFTWSSTLGIDAIAVHGGSAGFNVYTYDAEATSGSGFKAPANGNGLTAALSNASFCFDLELGSSIGATPTFTRSYDWTINKALVTASDANLTLSAGQTSAPVSYSVSLANTYVDSNWKLAGTFTITNPGFLPAAGVTASVTVSDAGAALVSCPATSIAAGGSMTCSYQAFLPDGNTRTVSLTATTNGAVTTITTSDADQVHLYGSGDVGGTNTATSVSFVTPTTLVDEEVSVDDNLKGALGVFNVASASLSTTYSLTFGPYAVCESKQIGNTASFLTNDRANVGSSTAGVTVNVVGCGSQDSGCTLTQGYWKTHSQVGPAPYDNAWLNLSAAQENTVFFLSGQSWIQVFGTPPAGNAYYTLAHQYMAAKLNILNGASATPAVTSAMAAAEALFAANQPTVVGKSKTLKDQFGALVGTLGSYNEGLTGPGHCSQ
jgi:hypothetical protein